MILSKENGHQRNQKYNVFVYYFLSMIDRYGFGVFTSAIVYNEFTYRFYNTMLCFSMALWSKISTKGQDLMLYLSGPSGDAYLFLRNSPHHRRRIMYFLE